LITLYCHNHRLSRPLKLFAFLGSYLEPFLGVDTVSSLLVDHQSFILQKLVKKQIAMGYLFCRQLLQLLSEHIIITGFGLITISGAAH
jgi:hypothetical protein